MSSLLRVLGTGSRDLADRGLVWGFLDALAVEFAPRRIVLVHGDCPTGFDQIADGWAAARGFGRESYRADWDSCAWDCPRAAHRRRKRFGDTAHPGMLDDYCPSAGPRRNALMVGLGADVCVAAPLGRSFGTRGCMRLAEAAGIPVRRVT